MVSAMRKISSQERSLVYRLLDRDVPGAEALRSQLFESFVCPINDDETILRFRLPAQLTRATLPCRKNVAVEGGCKAP